MDNPTSIQFLMIAHANGEITDKVAEHFYFAQSLVLLSKEGNFHSYPIESREQEGQEFYVDLLFSNMEEFKNEQCVFMESKSIFLELEDGELIEFKSLEKYSINEIAEHTEEDTFLYDPITLGKLELDY